MVAISLSGDAAKTLALAVISASQSPLLLLDADLEVVAVSDSFLRDFGLAALEVSGRSFVSLGTGEWNVPGLNAALSAVVAGEADLEAYNIDLLEPTGHTKNLILRAKRLPFVEPSELRILVTVIDNSEARAAAKFKADLIQDKEILLGELQHRVANSLQIIASLLLQNAKSASSAESRVHIQEAHQRIMSVASLQRQLASSVIADVAIKPYLRNICQSIGASMIEDGERISITVAGDDSTASGDRSVSLGLIVTELVINALKYAFPDARKGSISVDYHSDSDGWALSVCDDGVGLSEKKTAGAETSLGSAILRALANQLAATITVVGMNPGTGVSVVHRETVGLSTGERRAEPLRA